MSNPQVELHIAGHGVITLELDAEKAPLSTANFLSYVNNGHYNNTIFHRVIDNFMIQGGGYDTQYRERKTRPPVPHEGREALSRGGPRNEIGTVAMARTSDPHSATAQFFINVVDNEFLNFKAPTGNGWGYTVFGEVSEGKEVVDKIKAVKTGNQGFHQDVPLEAVLIEKATVIE